MARNSNIRPVERPTTLQWKVGWNKTVVHATSNDVNFGEQSRFFDAKYQTTTTRRVGSLSFIQWLNWVVRPSPTDEWRVTTSSVAIPWIRSTDDGLRQKQLERYAATRSFPLVLKRVPTGNSRLIGKIVNVVFTVQCDNGYCDIFVSHKGSEIAVLNHHPIRRRVKILCQLL